MVKYEAVASGDDPEDWAPTLELVGRDHSSTCSVHDVVLENPSNDFEYPTRTLPKRACTALSWGAVILLVGVMLTVTIVDGTGLDRKRTATSTPNQNVTSFL
jgi:hypothetical protein